MVRLRGFLITASALACAVTLGAPMISAQARDAKAGASAFLDSRAATYGDVALEIWRLAEVGYQEVKSSALLQEQLRAAGFDVKSGVGGMPTAFVASYGSGSPVIGVLAEFDALPGLTQDAVPERKPVAGKDAGHGCGHNLFGTGSAAAAAAVKDWLARSGTKGTLRVYGTPAEEGGAGKVYMVREGLFDDVDVVLHWHAGDRNDASEDTSLSNKSAKFRFRGVSAHAAGAPERGRSALDGVEAMTHMVNLMREHVPEDTRIHYVITSGGRAPNVVPDFAEVFLYVRHPDPREVASIFERIEKAAQGAALGTGTTVDAEIIHGTYNLLPNEALSRRIDANLRAVGGVRYTAEERAFAETIRKTLPGTLPPLEAAAAIEPFRVGGQGDFSTDVSDVSWVVPTAGVRTATYVPGTPGHSWQAVAATGSSIGVKGMMVAAKTLAFTAIDLFSEPALVAAARAEHKEKVGPGFTYKSLVGNRPPPLDYRKK
jgi:aminobenzoyl-glutamate utilization protein B